MGWFPFVKYMHFEPAEMNALVRPAMQLRCAYEKEATATITMPQTRVGASENQPWIAFMRRCAAEYHAQRAAERAQQTAYVHQIQKQRKARTTEKGQEAESAPQPPGS